MMLVVVVKLPTEHTLASVLFSFFFSSVFLLFFFCFVAFEAQFRGNLWKAARKFSKRLHSKERETQRRLGLLSCAKIDDLVPLSLHANTHTHIHTHAGLDTNTLLCHHEAWCKRRRLRQFQASKRQTKRVHVMHEAKGCPWSVGTEDTHARRCSEVVAGGGRKDAHTLCFSLFLFFCASAVMLVAPLQ